jgi:hypothetical protein
VSGFHAVEQTDFDYWASSFSTAHELGLSPHWLTFLHRSASIEQMRAPGLLVRLLAATRTLSPEILRALNPGLFPVEALERKKHVAALLYGQDWGLDVLTPLAQAGISQVDIGHPDNAELRRLERTYNTTWCYHRLAGTSFFQQAEKADLVIADHPARSSETPAHSAWPSLIRRTSREYLFSVNETVMRALECNTSDVISIQDRLQRFLRRSVILRGVFFRYRYPEHCHWLWLEIPTA